MTGNAKYLLDKATHYSSHLMLLIIMLLAFKRRVDLLLFCHNTAVEMLRVIYCHLFLLLLLFKIPVNNVIFNLQEEGHSKSKHGWDDANLLF